MRIGIVSDTHGLLRREVIEGLQGVDHIIHAGDIDKKEVLSECRWPCTESADSEPYHQENCGDLQFRRAVKRGKGKERSGIDSELLMSRFETYLCDKAL